MSYHNLCLFYKGEISLDELIGADDGSPAGAAVMYGAANWHYYNGDVEEANARLKRHLESRSWSAFGFIAAEADIASRQTP